jgi:predicted enzyme related to lactoylglutathione lyase
LSDPVAPARGVADADGDARALWRHVLDAWAVAASREATRVRHLLHPAYLGWDTRSASPHDREAAVAAACDPDAPVIVAYALEPLGVNVYGGATGVVHYRYRATVESSREGRSDVRGHWTEVYAKDGSDWLMVSVTGRPDDVAPHRRAAGAARAIYFDLSVADLDAARTFFERALGWRLERFPMAYPYWRITTGASDEPGIDGGLGRLDDAPVALPGPTTVITVRVDDIDRTLVRVDEAGGRVVEPKTRIPGVGAYATCAEPGGLRFGVLQPDGPEGADQAGST